MATPIHPNIASWQSASYELGLLQFLQPGQLAEQSHHPVPADHTPIALCEADTLAVNDRSGQLVLFDHEQANRILCLAADNQQSLLAALEILQTHFKHNGEDDYYFYDQSNATRTVEA